MSQMLGVVGSGTMGAGIAEVGARNGCEVVLVDTYAPALDRTIGGITKSLERAAMAGKLAEPVADVVARIGVAGDLSALAACDIVIEAIRENAEDKIAVFRQLDEILAGTAVVATNTSSIPVARLAAATAHPERLLGLHFFNPVPVMQLVELVPSLLTADWAKDRLWTFAADVLGKQVILAKDQGGFVVNAILVPYLLSAIRSLDNGVASRDDIDSGLVGGCGMPMGPLRLCDLVGLDTLLLASDSLYDEYRDPSYAAPPLLRRQVDAGLLGRKTGRGFYDYAD